MFTEKWSKKKAQDNEANINLMKPVKRDRMSQMLSLNKQDSKELLFGSHMDLFLQSPPKYYEHCPTVDVVDDAKPRLFAAAQSGGSRPLPSSLMDTQA